MDQPILSPPLVSLLTAEAISVLSREPAVFVQPCRLTISLIQMGAKGDVQPFETG